MVTLDRPIEWQKSTLTPDSYGQSIETWVKHKTVWAKLVPMRGFENYEANQKVSVGNVRYVVRWDDGWLVRDRLYDGGNVYEIESIQEFHPTKAIDPNTREHYLLLDCTDRDSENTGRDGS